MFTESLVRREWLAAVWRSALGLSASGFIPRLAQAASTASPRRHCILLWMSGGPAQTDTFDLKPGHANGGEFQEIATTVPGMRFSEHLPQLAKHADQLAIIRSLATKEGDHARGTHLMRTGHKPMGPIDYPAIGAALGKHLGAATDVLPNYISVAPFRVLSQGAFGPGFLGPRYAPLVIGDSNGSAPAVGRVDSDEFAELSVKSLKPASSLQPRRQMDRRAIWQRLQKQFLKEHPAGPAAAHDTVYRSAMHLMDSDASSAFDLSQEPTAIREKYGKGQFGQSCLLARRLVERGVGFVEVTLGGWDTHSDNFTQVGNLSATLDRAWVSLMEDLQQRGLLETTTILWMGEFGRTPRINAQAGRDHFPSAWSCVLAGGGIQGGSVYGKTSDDGLTVVDQPVEASQVLATICAAVGIDPTTENTSNTGRPVPIVDSSPIRELLV